MREPRQWLSENLAQGARQSAKEEKQIVCEIFNILAKTDKHSRIIAD
jgi:hypothetical protein